MIAQIGGKWQVRINITTVISLEAVNRWVVVQKFGLLESTQCVDFKVVSTNHQTLPALLKPIIG